MIRIFAGGWCTKLSFRAKLLVHCHMSPAAVTTAGLAPLVGLVGHLNLSHLIPFEINY